MGVLIFKIISVFSIVVPVLTITVLPRFREVTLLAVELKFSMVRTGVKLE